MLFGSQNAIFGVLHSVLLALLVLRGWLLFSLGNIGWSFRYLTNLIR